jgi:5'-3' exonuclease
MVKVHLLDGTYELFRHHYGLPPEVRARGSRTAATRGVLNSVRSMIEHGVTHLGVATDHVIESFRNDMWPGYKDSTGVDPDLLAQFPLLEEELAAMGVQVFPMVELEADDALASAAAVAAEDERVEQVVICTPDKDLGQCVVGQRVVQLDRRKNVVLDEAGVLAKFGVLPTSIPDWLALVGDSADGFPGLKGWGAKAASAVLRCYGHIEDIPRIGERWTCDVRGARTLANTLEEQRDLAMLFRDLATLRIDRSILTTIDELAAPPTRRPAGPGTGPG